MLRAHSDAEESGEPDASNRSLWFAALPMETQMAVVRGGDWAMGKVTADALRNWAFWRANGSSARTR